MNNTFHANNEKINSARHNIYLVFNLFFGHCAEHGEWWEWHSGDNNWQVLGETNKWVRDTDSSFFPSNNEPEFFARSPGRLSCTIEAFRGHASLLNGWELQVGRRFRPRHCTPCANLRRPTEFQWPEEEEDAISMSRCQVGLIRWLNHKQSNLLVLLITPILCCQQKLASFSTSPLTATDIQFDYCTFTESESVLKQCRSACQKCSISQPWVVMWLVTGIFGLFNMILHRIEESKLRIGEDSSLWRVSKNQTWYCDGVSTDFGGFEEFTFYKNFWPSRGI